MRKIGTPVVILGAPRSGTNLLRDLISGLPGYGTWPCDEINAIWRYGNSSYPTDELLPAHAGPRVRKFVRRQFALLKSRRGFREIVEKTCANSLRVQYVDRILPEAVFISLVRDGRDASASAMGRWGAPVNWRYIARKARYVPPAEVPRYAMRFLANRLPGQRARSRLWGPVFEGLSDRLCSEGLAAACAAQWARCVSRTSQDLAHMDPRRVVYVRYEEFVASPETEIARLADFLQVTVEADQLSLLTSRVTDANVGKWKVQLSPEDLATVIRVAGAVLSRHGYDS